MSEQRIVDSIRRKLERVGAVVVKTQGSANRKGEPDLVACFPWRPPGSSRSIGVHVSLEVKQPGKKPTPIQLARLRAYRRAGGVALWVDSAEEIVTRIEEELNADHRSGEPSS